MRLRFLGPRALILLLRREEGSPFVCVRIMPSLALVGVIVIVVVVVVIFGVGGATEEGAAFGAGAADSRKIKTHRSAYRITAHGEEGAYGFGEEGHGRRVVDNMTDLQVVENVVCGLDGIDCWYPFVWSNERMICALLLDAE